MPPASAPSAGLSRADSRTSITSIHARNALRRMATHETGTGIEKEYDGAEDLVRPTGSGNAPAGPSRTRATRDGKREQDMEVHDEAHEHDLVVTPVASRRGSSPVAKHRYGPTQGAVLGSEKRGEGGDDEKDLHRDSSADGHEHDAPHGSERSQARRGKKGKEDEEFVLQDQTNLLPAKQILIIFSGLSMAMICAMLDQTTGGEMVITGDAVLMISVTTALPTLGRVFNRADIASWVGTAFLLTSTPMYGRLSDIFGRKPCLLASLVVFFIGALGCSVSQSMIMLIVFRAVEGIGGGGILTLTMIIVSDIVTLEERGKYQGIIGVVVAFSNSVGPIVGGSLTEKATWRACWWLIMPITFLAFIIIYFLLPLKHVSGSYASKLRQVDWYGSFLTLAWAVLVLVALSWAGTEYSWSSAAVLAPLLIGIALLGVFLWVELKVVKLPLIPLYIFQDKTVIGGMAITFLSGIGFYVSLYYLPQYFQQVRGLSAIRSGVLVLPLSVVQTVCVFIAGYSTSKTGDYWYSLTIGFVFWTIGLGLMTTVDQYASDAKMVGYQIILGVGAGQTFQTSLVAIQAAVDRKDMATATGTRNFLRMLGGTIGLAACGTLVNNLAGKTLLSRGYDQAYVDRVLKDPVGEQHGVDAQIVEDIRAAFADGIRGVWYLLVPCVGLCFFLAIFLVKRIPLKRADDAKRKEEAKQWMKERKANKRKGSAGSVHGDDLEAQDGVAAAAAVQGQEQEDDEKAAGAERRDSERRESENTVVGDHGQDGASKDGQESRGHLHGIVHEKVVRLEHELEEAGRGAEEAFGAGIPRVEGLQQGPIGSDVPEKK